MIYYFTFRFPLNDMSGIFPCSLEFPWRIGFVKAGLFCGQFWKDPIEGHPFSLLSSSPE